ncbi:CopD family protein [Pseudoroseicyclus tamaricis]|uniref:CopD family protein n=1 Tax=Pseudoroseicyclus tamaricis TaxID=2705421 RepID=UPI001432AF7B|nr:CopD family protein [Pseudoroseicyclus tamaricis]
MIDWVVATVPLFKVLHIAALCIWCGGLIVLPLMLARHDPAVVEEDYRLIRRGTHIAYTMGVTPAAVIAVIAGTWLIFLRGAFVPWLFAKLAFVALLVLIHAWVGHVVAQVAEEPGTQRPPEPYLPVAAVLFCVVAILVLVLAKPDIGTVSFPDWMMEPRDNQLLFDVPSR